MPRKPSMIKSAEDVYSLMKGLGRLRRERVYTILLDGDNQVLGLEEVSRGSSFLTDGHPGPVFGSACRVRQCNSVIIVHNHPSGKAEPSLEDRDTTRRLYEDGLALGIGVADSVIIADGSYYSFRESGKMEGYKGRE